jgi:branched-chain amino acid transport system substrate-binding protein
LSKGNRECCKANGGKMPTREQVAKAVREIKDFQGITGVINFNKNGDLTVAKYYIIQVVSDDPEKWSENPIVETLDIAPPER